MHSLTNMYKELFFCCLFVWRALFSLSCSLSLSLSLLVLHRLAFFQIQKWRVRCLAFILFYLDAFFQYGTHLSFSLSLSIINTQTDTLSPYFSITFMVRIQYPMFIEHFLLLKILGTLYELVKLVL